ncbi:GPP34 family phosphoprotein [Clostridium sp. SHJSY1]|uniref:GPP34 family phosphoprotein n=1 Tax=Clostridium sp. SHJSY1 TaxID=2942483 RepID=UPI002874DA84|nr:GPP34 family phosphoprotein [Clostridium sp. SHJSY1]MDS0525674.1 GPP34 family phosphoprotein [Clostridium sp. SHJSY1]
MNKSVTKQYALLVMNKRFNINSFLVRDFLVATIAAGLFELEKNKVLKVEYSKNNITFSIQKKLPDKLNYLSEIYNVILDCHEKTLYDVIKLFNMESNRRYSENYVQGLTHSMVKSGVLSETKKNKLFGKEKTSYVVNKETVNEIIKYIRETFLYDKSDDEECCILSILLNRTGLLKSYFGKDEADIIVNKIKKLIKGDYGLTTIIRGLDDLIVMSLGFVKFFT